MNQLIEITTRSRSSVQAGDNKTALEILHKDYDLLPSGGRKMVDMLLGRINRIAKYFNYGVIGHDDLMLEENKIGLSITYLIDELSNNVTKSPNSDEKISLDYLTDKYLNLKILVKEELEETENQENAKEAMEEIQKFLSSFIPELKGFSNNFHEKLISQVRDENVFKIAPKRVFVFGESNAGKTTTINNLLKSDVFDMELFPASDKFNLTQTLNCGEHEGGLIIYDSPGIGDDETPENVTRASLSIRQKEEDKVDKIILIDATKNKKEGPNEFKKLSESEILKHLNKDAYFKRKDNINGKEFNISNFQDWAKSKFDFYIFIISGGLSKGLNKKQVKFLKEFYSTIGTEQKVFKIINIVNNRKESRYKLEFEQFDDDVKDALYNSIEEFKTNNFPHPEDWIFVESNFGKGFDKVIESIKSLNPDTLISIEKSIKSDYSHLIHHKIDGFYFKYVSFVASIVGCYPVDFWVDGNTLLSYSIKSIFVVSEYIYQDSKNINPDVLDSFIKKIKKSRKDYKDTSYYKTETINKPPKYKGTNTMFGDWINETFGDGNYEYFDPEKKKVRVDDEEKFYRIGGKLAITATLAIGISLYEIYRGKKKYSESELLAKINQLNTQISKDFVPSDIPEKLRKHKHSELRALKIKEIQPEIENFAKKYLSNLK